MATDRGARSVPKLVGADFELGNFIQGLERSGGTGPEASRALLREIPGVTASSGWGVWSATASGGWAWEHPQDRGRKFLPSNGGCAYIDLDHLELCIPEVRSAFDHAAASAAMLRIAREAQRRADAALPAGQSLRVLVNNSDGLSNSYGSHLNFLVSRALLFDLLERRPHYLHFLASHQLSSMVYAGQGKVGSENGRPGVAYQISQRADFVETLVGHQTTYRRPVVNARDEALCGSRNGLARLHVIFFDNTLCSGASVLKVGAMQLVLAMLEAEDVDPRLCVDDPVGAAVVWSHDPALRARARLVDGSAATAVELQQRVLEAALRHRDRRGFSSVPRADEILSLWEDTLVRLSARDFDALTGRLDWVLKQRMLERAIEADRALAWDSPAVKHLDQIYGSLDPDEGLFSACRQAGLIEPWVREEAIEHFVHEPPEDTRAWLRAMLLRRLDASEIERIDWDRIVLRGGVDARREIPMDDPLGFTRAETAHLFDRPARARRTS